MRQIVSRSPDALAGVDSRFKVADTRLRVYDSRHFQWRPLPCCRDRSFKQVNMIKGIVRLLRGSLHAH